MRVLVVEDDQALADVIARGLRQEALAVDVAYDGEEAIDKASFTSYDVVVLDRDLPKVHGDDVCRHLTSGGNGERILMLTASGTLDDRVSGLALGADDSLPKPFAMKELVARVRALGRRVPAVVPPLLTHGNLTVDVPQRRVVRAGREIRLTRKEFGVLEVLTSAGGRVVSSEELLEKVWDENTDPFTNAIRITVMTLRRKLGDPPIIETVVGVGYRLV
ncbi:MAG: response regulator transcription factor [Acidimicrobiales bacterium]|nr:response regulator transcription factor [Acidimicrobiales bacterium]